jgi:small subunit ribosomal protein S1
MSTDPNSTPASSNPPFSASAEAAVPPAGRARGEVDSSLEAEISAALGNMSVDDLIGERPRARQAAPAQGPRGGRQLRKGKVFRIHGGDVFIEFGPRSQGVCPVTQFPELPEVGTELEFFVERLDAFEGLLVLSRPGAVQKADWGSLEVGQVVEARCIGMNKGGLEMEVAHHKGFMPAGMVDLRHIPDISVFIGEKFPCEIVELNKDRNRLILSRKAVMLVERSQKKTQLLEELEPGQIRPATITSVQAYGAFADLGGIDGLIHISELSHDRLKHASDAVKVGDTVQVKVKAIDRSQDPPKISLSRRDTISDPSAAALTEMVPGATVTGRVTKLAEFGAFVELAPGIEGLVHISEVSHERIPSVDRVLKRDEVITCKILSIDPGKRRISLSIKALMAAPERPAGTGPSQGQQSGRPGRGRRDSDAHEPARLSDPGLKKLMAKFGSDRELKGGIG